MCRSIARTGSWSSLRGDRSRRSPGRGTLAAGHGLKWAARAIATSAGDRHLATPRRARACARAHARGGLHSADVGRDFAIAVDAPRPARVERDDRGVGDGVAERVAVFGALEERDADDAAVADDQRGRLGALDVVEGRGDAHALLREGLAVGKGEGGVAVL